MKKIALLLLTATLILILPGCKKLIESLTPVIPDDSTTTVPTPTEVGTLLGDPFTKTIGKTGGSIASADGNAELIFPEGALEDNTSISVQAVTQTAPNGVGHAYKFLPDGIQFKKPVTLKFHYTADDLAATLGDLMGIAFQDTIGGWWRVNNFTNDTVSKIISAPIKHFTAYTAFDILFINPPGEVLRINKSLDLKVDIIASDDDDLTKLGANEEELVPLIKVGKKIVWSANGVANGNSSFGTLTAVSLAATYKAPAKVPAQNPVLVSAQVQTKFKYHGKIFDKTLLASTIKIIDGENYLLEIRETETADPFAYGDTASLMVLVSADGKVTVSDISNFPPEITPETATVGDCTATWVPDGIGEINITGVTGTISGSSGDPNRSLILQFQHSGTITPKFHRVCIGDEATDGGFAMVGFPTLLSFSLKPDAGIYFLDDGQEFARLTLQE